MNGSEIKAAVCKLSARHRALGGGGLALVADPGLTAFWCVTSAGGRPNVRSAADTVAAAIGGADAQLALLEAKSASLAQTLGIEAAL